MCQGSLQQHADRDVGDMHVDRGVSINSYELLLDGVCNAVEACSKEAVAISNTWDAKNALQW